MKSVRLGADLEAKLRQAAGSAGMSESELIRQAVAERTDEVLGGGLLSRLEGIVGAVHSGGGRARHASGKYIEVLRKKREQRSKLRS